MAARRKVRQEDRRQRCAPPACEGDGRRARDLFENTRTVIVAARKIDDRTSKKLRRRCCVGSYAGRACGTVAELCTAKIRRKSSTAHGMTKPPHGDARRGSQGDSGTRVAQKLNKEFESTAPRRKGRLYASGKSSYCVKSRFCAQGMLDNVSRGGVAIGGPVGEGELGHRKWHGRARGCGSIALESGGGKDAGLSHQRFGWHREEAQARV
ncbi:hypothetical protein C8J57DRAFT_1238107 [Mycena rebaudengoi]|nr:hypothetical protein C8J57DRAFT_1238107 [Mycena rebaudengoi]